MDYGNHKTKNGLWKMVFICNYAEIPRSTVHQAKFELINKLYIVKDKSYKPFYGKWFIGNILL